jgi:hypothetical protein
MEDGWIKINSVKQNFKTIMNGYEDGKLLRIQGTIIPRKQDFAASMDLSPSSLRLWHYRFGHLNFESLSKLKIDEMVKGLPTFKKETSKCEACIIGKQKRDPFLTSTWQANICLQLIHSDICGPMESSFGGCKYFILFIDDFTRMTWVYFLKDKSKAFEKFIHFQCLVENATKENISTLRTNNGGEFTSNEFNDYCRKNGIKR